MAPRGHIIASVGLPAHKLRINALKVYSLSRHTYYPQLVVASTQCTSESKTMEKAGLLHRAPQQWSADELSRFLEADPALARFAETTRALDLDGKAALALLLARALGDVPPSDDTAPGSVVTAADASTLLDRLVGAAGNDGSAAVAASVFEESDDGWGGEHAAPDSGFVALDAVLGLDPAPFPPCATAPTLAARSIAHELIRARVP